MSEDNKVNQPKNDVQEAEVKQTQTDEIKEEAKFTQTDMNRVVQQRLEAEKAKQQREIAEIKKKGRGNS